VDLDVNIKAHDLLWRLMDPAIKKRYTESFGARKSQIVDSEIAKLVQSGLVFEKDNRYELTSKGLSIYNLLTKQKGCCQPM
jgi:predicted transcriptional regulator